MSRHSCRYLRLLRGFRPDNLCLACIGTFGISLRIYYGVSGAYLQRRRHKIVSWPGAGLLRIGDEQMGMESDLK